MQADNLGKDRNYLTVEDAVHLQKSRTGTVCPSVHLTIVDTIQHWLQIQRWFIGTPLYDKNLPRNKCNVALTMNLYEDFLLFNAFRTIIKQRICKICKP